MNPTQEHRILLYYQYVRIEDPKAFMDEQRALCTRLGLKGRIIVAHEGLNGTVEGTVENTAEYMRVMQADKRFATMHFKKSQGTGNAFPRLSIKVRPEIVTLGTTITPDAQTPDEVLPEPGATGGTYLEPAELQRWFEQGKSFKIVDMRNDYEHLVGHFEGSVLPGIKNFRDLEKVVQSELMPYKEETILSVCTGGVRCEKGSAVLKKHGFKNVYQLHGGMATYMEQFPNQFFKGSLYVFDGRVTTTFDDPDKHVVVGRCALCKEPSERYVNCADDACHNHIIACLNCSEDNGQVFCSRMCRLRDMRRRIIGTLTRTLKRA